MYTFSFLPSITILFLTWDMVYCLKRNVIFLRVLSCAIIETANYSLLCALIIYVFVANFLKYKSIMLDGIKSADSMALFGFPFLAVRVLIQLIILKHSGVVKSQFCVGNTLA